MYQITASTRKIRARILPALWVGGKFICFADFSEMIQNEIFYTKLLIARRFESNSCTMDTINRC
jgi:hypothetical protein